MYQKPRNNRWISMALMAFLPALALAQPAQDVRALQQQMEALKAGQDEMQKSLQIIKNILMESSRLWRMFTSVPWAPNRKAPLRRGWP